jgi:hypothetical protein
MAMTHFNLKVDLIQESLNHQAFLIYFKESKQFVNFPFSNFDNFEIKNLLYLNLI